MADYITVWNAQKKQASENTNEDKAAGALSVYVFWPDGMDADIDVHVLDANKQHTYYDNKETHITNLLRDDRGMLNDQGPRNFENVYVRELPPGEYVINLHAFRAADKFYPIPVEGELNFIDPTGGKGGGLTFKKTVELLKTGEEITLFRFLVGQDGKIVPYSLNHILRPFIFKKDNT